MKICGYMYVLYVVDKTYYICLKLCRAIGTKKTHVLMTKKGWLQDKLTKTLVAFLCFENNQICGL